MDSIQLGHKVKDKISGFEGTVTSKCDYIAAPSRCGVTPLAKENAKAVEETWFDIGRLVPIDCEAAGSSE